MITLLFQHQLQQIFINSFQFDSFKLETSFNRIVKTFGNHISILLISFQRLDINRSLLVGNRKITGDQEIIKDSVAPHIAFVKLDHL